MALAPSVSQLHLIFLLLLVFVCDSVDVFWNALMHGNFGNVITGPHLGTLQEAS